MYQEKSSLQIEEDEQEDLNRIKEESRRRRQTILEKYNTKSLVPQLEDTCAVFFLFFPLEHIRNLWILFVLNNLLVNVFTAKEILGTLEGQRESLDSNTWDTPFLVGRSPPQNGNSGVERTFGTCGIEEGTPKVRFIFLFSFLLNV